MDRIRIIDSHSGGEPTRVVVHGGPDLGSGPLCDRAARFRRQHDHWRSAIACEPRGSDSMVGALLVEPSRQDCVTGVIFFNNVSTLGMCGHGTMGLIAALAHLGRIGPGRHCVETPVGVVSADLHHDGRVSVENVSSYRHAAGVAVDVPAHGVVRGDVAWGGNWFFLVDRHQQRLDFDNIETLTDYCWRLRQALERSRVTGAAGATIDHIELCAPSPVPSVDSRNFVLCPGKAYDRSPCGTGTSAKLACLAADGRLAPGEVWRQESIIGSVFEGQYRWQGSRVLPRITGQAFISGQGDLLFDCRDPFRYGVHAVPSRPFCLAQPA